MSRSSALALLIGAVVLLHAPWQGACFHYDDGHSVVRNPHIRQLADFPRFFIDAATFSERPEYGMYRPLVVLSYALNYAWTGLEPAGFQLLNVFIHALVSASVFALLTSLGYAATPALMGAAFFAFHPLQTEVTHYISARSESLAALGVLLSALAHLRYHSKHGRLLQGLSWLSYAMALLCKPTALVLPLLLPVLDRCSPDWRRSGQSRGLTIWIPYGLISLVYLAMYRSISPGGMERAAAVRPWVAQLATQCKALTHYLLVIAVPVEQSVLRQFSVSSSWWTPTPASSLLLLGSLGLIALRLRLPVPVLGFALSWSFISLLPTLIIPLHVLVNDHRPYLALVGPCLWIAHLARTRRGLRMVVMLTIVLSLLAAKRSMAWASERRLWQSAVNLAPHMVEASYNLGHAYHEAGKLQEARQAYLHALTLNPAYAPALAGLGTVLRQQGHSRAAIQRLEEALRQDATLAAGWNNLGLARRDIGDTSGAERAFLHALHLQPGAAEVHYNLGLLYRDIGRRDAALAHLRQAIQLDPEISQRYPVPRHP